MDNRIFLKVKLKSLAAEARIIRHEEKLKRNKEHQTQLWNHRTKDVRAEARATLLAYGYIKGMPRNRIEQTEKPFDYNKVKSMVYKYGEPIFDEKALKEWCEAKITDESLSVR